MSGSSEMDLTLPGAAAPSARPAVKICGIMRAETLKSMDGMPVEYIGFIFAPKSRRYVAPELAGELIRASRESRMAGGRPPLAVGVFVDPSLETLEATLTAAPLDVVQLHGKGETPDFCREVARRFKVEVWRALSAGGEEQASDGSADDAEVPDAGPARLAAYAGAVSAVLIDTAGGGTGRAFPWEVIPAYERAASETGIRLFVAGGLDPDNVIELLSAYKPDGVDISSGVETDGVKDATKIAAFAERVKQQS
ncbi:phosphoribosylanthranilate isomerase [Cohnella rhizosphaerae]|uniref:N-(5'-phosphoribosyl)anthranilate isomerase n=1 Tax=Cohnella rhizosphaerae TaxID=1457232 RepID=A0A9X4KYG7_9BACL|nr:phosphoribosylanthranilate isomerase [Cohnella rhizosphaerae]MDG0813093.1 phosphoribosylanthranilate isomerase [Cohnella rhizosphaerae]